VGGVNFAWDYETNEEIKWPMADPVQILSLDDLISTVEDEYWKEEIEEYIQDEENGKAFLELSADAYHKDNISGGPAYALEITNEPSVDSRYLNLPYETTLINHLRICFETCGFPGVVDPKFDKDFEAFYFKVKPRLKEI
jgi:hypothetical protein